MPRYIPTALPRVAAIPFCVLASLLCLILTAGCGPAKDQADIRAAYAAMDAAASAKDTDKIMSYYADDYKAPAGVNITTSKDAIRRELAGSLQMATSIKTKTVVDSIEVTGTTAKATATADLEMSINNPILGKTSNLKVSNTVEDTWTKTAAGWKLQSSLRKSVKANLDGKDVNLPAGMGGG